MDQLNALADKARHIVNNLLGVTEGGIDSEEPVILAADDLAPSETLQLDKSKILGFIIQGGSGNSHTAILARTMGIPAICGLGDQFKAELNGRTACIDAETGKVAMDPDEITLTAFQTKLEKQVDYFEMRKEENPALGVRAICICLNRPEVFRTQPRALYRASAYGKVAIKFPMITSVWEVKECKRACQKVMAELDKEGIPYNKYTELGIMIETPASVLGAEELAREVDFFSVSTNDLTQYTLARDRQANDLGKFFNPHHPAVLRALKIATDAAHKAGSGPASAASWGRTWPCWRLSWSSASTSCPFRHSPCCPSGRRSASPSPKHVPWIN